MKYHQMPTFSEFKEIYKKETQFKRQCPKCEKPIYYHSEESLYAANKKESVCRNCCDKGSHQTVLSASEQQIVSEYLKYKESVEYQQLIAKPMAKEKLPKKRTIICLQCQKEYSFYQYRQRRLFCSANCYNTYLRVNHHKASIKINV